jgi:hypothetical protein
MELIIYCTIISLINLVLQYLTDHLFSYLFNEEEYNHQFNIISSVVIWILVFLIEINT